MHGWPPVEERVYRWAVVGVLMAAGLAGIAWTQDSGEQLLDRMLEAHGGLERFEAVREWRIVADRRIEQDGGVLEEIYEESMLRDAGGVRTLLVKRRPSETLVYGHDGARGYVVDNGAVRSGVEAEEEGYYRAHGEYYLRAIPFKWADPGVVVTPRGRETSGLLLLEVRARDGVGRDFRDVWVAAIDPETFRLREARLTHRGDRQITYRYSDYRAVGDLLFPFRLEYHSEGTQTGENVVRSFELSPGLTPAVFSAETYRSPP